MQLGQSSSLLSLASASALILPTASTLLLPAARMLSNPFSSAISSVKGAVGGAVVSRFYDAVQAQLPAGGLSIPLPLSADKIAKFTIGSSATSDITLRGVLLGAGATYFALQLLRPSSPPPVKIIINVNSDSKETKISQKTV